MLAFHNDESIKKKYLARVRTHRKADQLTKGKDWENGKGCAVWCTIHSNNHNAYETELGIPEWLARVKDVIFKGLPNKQSQLWPERFFRAIKPGVDLDKIKAPFMTFILEYCLDSTATTKYDVDKFLLVKKAIDQSKKVVQRIIKALKKEDWKEVEAGVYEVEAAARDAWAVASAVCAVRATWAAEVVVRADFKNFSDKLIELIEGL